jgi:hypothetical protein
MNAKIKKRGRLSSKQAEDAREARHGFALLAARLYEVRLGPAVAEFRFMNVASLVRIRSTRRAVWLRTCVTFWGKTQVTRGLSGANAHVASGIGQRDGTSRISEV